MYTLLALLILSAPALDADTASASPVARPVVAIGVDDESFRLSTPELGVIRERAGRLEAVGAERFPSGATVVWWYEDETPFYALSLDGRKLDVVRATTFDIPLRYGTIRPGLSVPVTEPALSARAGGELQIVQFVSQPIEEYRAGLRAAGVRIERYLANHAYVVRMDAATGAAIAHLPYVNWVGAFEPAYKLEESILEALRWGEPSHEAAPYTIQVWQAGPAQKESVAAEIAAVGGRVDKLTPNGMLVEATLTLEQVTAVAALDDVAFVERRVPPTTYMNIVRNVGGGNFVEFAGFTGAGVRGEVMDSNLYDAHVDFQANPPIFHGGHGGSSSHGTSVYGIVFGTGTGNPLGRGMCPDAQGIFADFGNLSDRYAHIAELNDPPYEAVFQTNSWGQCCTINYTTLSAEMDLITFDQDIVILQAQANNGNQSSDYTTWAKNIVSVGGIRHYNTLTLADDQHAGAGSTGPAFDGRVKPDLSFFYDDIYTTSNNGGYTTSFGGTSAATPETAGHFGLFFQMWHEGIFGNPVDPNGTVFSNRPHMTTSKAMVINCANPYFFDAPNDDLRRFTQGWGLPNVQSLYQRRAEMLIVNETDVLTNLGSKTYLVEVGAAAPWLRATLVYADLPGVVNSQRHRINDLTLQVIAPNGTLYWGNNGLLSGNESTPGGTPNTIDTVENVWIADPAPGIWQVIVSAPEIVEDAHVETPQVDADFALVVSGVQPVSGGVPGDLDGNGCVDQADLGILLADYGCTAGIGNCPGDVDGDGDTDQSDLGVVLTAFEQTPCP